MSLSSPLIVALVPMKHHSVRVPGKNHRLLGGIPLYHHIIKTLGKCSSISEIIIDTDSQEIQADVQTTFPKVRIIERPKDLCGDMVPMTDVLYYDSCQVSADLYLQTHCTNPFLLSRTIEKAVSRWEELSISHDSLFSVTRLQSRFWDSKSRPINHEPETLLRTQDVTPIYLENSCLYLFPSKLIKETRRRIGGRPYFLEINQLEALDIDDEIDFRLAELILEAQIHKQS